MITNMAEENWANEVASLCTEYNIIKNEHIALMSSQAYKLYINKKIEAIAFKNLQDDCRSKKKTENLTYSHLRLQPYLYKMNPQKARTIFRARSHMTNTKKDMKNKFVNENPYCRLCNSAEESLYHIVNCGQDVLITPENINKLFYENINDIKEATTIADRIENFIQIVNEN